METKCGAAEEMHRDHRSAGGTVQVNHCATYKFRVLASVRPHAPSPTAINVFYGLIAPV